MSLGSWYLGFKLINFDFIMAGSVNVEILISASHAEVLDCAVVEICMPERAVTIQYHSPCDVLADIRDTELKPIGHKEEHTLL